MRFHMFHYNSLFFVRSNVDLEDVESQFASDSQRYESPNWPSLQRSQLFPPFLSNLKIMVNVTPMGISLFIFFSEAEIPLLFGKSVTLGSKMEVSWNRGTPKSSQSSDRDLVF